MKDSDIKTQLIDILSLHGSSSVAQKCITALDRPPVIELSQDILGKTKELLHTYGLRVEMHHSVIEGGDDLINALEKETGELVRLNWFRTDKEEFFIFTDPELKRLIGCMAILRVLSSNIPR